MASRFLIEIPHEATKASCLRAIESILKSGSHLVTQADWGCKDGEHKCWLVVEMESKDDARAIIPPALRTQARVTQLNAFSMAEVEAMLGTHGG